VIDERTEAAGPNQRRKEADMSMDERIVVVTGGAMGIGRAIADGQRQRNERSTFRLRF